MECYISGAITGVKDFERQFEKAENEQITTAVIKEGVTTIEKWAFKECTNLQSVVIPEGVAIIGEWAFEDCTNLQSVVIPSSVTEIRSGAFYGCSNLTVTFDRTKEKWEKIEGVDKCEAKNVKFNK